MKSLEANKLIELLSSANNSLKNNKDRINALNVFPVPDGDTGSNMTSTMSYAFDQIKNQEGDSLIQIMKNFSRGALMGARGNSGVILSQVFKGFSLGFNDENSLTIFSLVKAFRKASDIAYEAVFEPVEGTILTVVREVAENLEKTITPSHTIIDVFDYAVKFARTSCDNTPNLLPILKEVGVVDSGGEGFVVILEGMLSALRGSFVELKGSDFEPNSFIFGEEDYNGEFGYCTEFIINLKNPNSFSKNKFLKSLTEKYGSSIVVVHDEDILKVHLHTLKPGSVLTFGQKYGEFIKIKSENMTLQANESQASKRKQIEPQNPESRTKIPKSGEVSVISCNNGSGVIDEMYNLGANYIIEAGQTSNPSASDFIKAIDKIKSNKIIILPNNSNIVLVAQQVVQTISDKELIIIPTKNQAQGIVAMLNFSVQNTLEENREHMEDGANSVKVIQVTQAIRDTKINGLKIKENDTIGIVEGKIVEKSDSKVDVSCKILDKLVDDESELITIYYGEDATKVDANEIKNYIEVNFEDVDVEIKNGNQPIYSLLLSIE